MEKYRKYAGWLLAGICLLALFLTAAACLKIYLAGGGYSRESIALSISAVAPALIFCLAAAAAVIPGAMMGKEKDGNDQRGLYRRGREGKNPFWVSAVLLGSAVVFILLGVINGGARDVLIKAINICTECIGLG